MNPTRHEQIRAALAGAALDALSPATRDRVLAHVRLCPHCARELDSLREAAASLAHLGSSHGDGRKRIRRTRSRLLARAVGDAPPAPESPWPARPMPRAHAIRLPRAPETGWLVAAGLAGLLLTHHSFHRPVAHGWLAAGALGGALLGAMLYAHRLRRRLRALETSQRVAEAAGVIPPR